eukprot:6685276-Karenia_brevis.AAC.1
MESLFCQTYHSSHICIPKLETQTHEEQSYISNYSFDETLDEVDTKIAAAAVDAVRLPFSAYIPSIPDHADSCDYTVCGCKSWLHQIG